MLYYVDGEKVKYPEMGFLGKAIHYSFLKVILNRIFKGKIFKIKVLDIETVVSRLFFRWSDFGHNLIVAYGKGT